MKGTVSLKKAAELINDIKFLKKASLSGWDYVWIWRYVVGHLQAAMYDCGRNGLNVGRLRVTLDNLVSTRGS